MKVNFGKFAIINHVRHYFKEAPEYYWEFRPATSQDELTIYQFYLDHPNATWIEVAWRELALTFGGTNIPNEDDEPVLEYPAKVDDVEAVLKQLPLNMVVELWEALKEANPLWGPQKLRQESEQSPKS